MDLVTLSVLAKAAPTAIRALGKLFGGNTEKAAHEIADVADAVQGRAQGEREQEIGKAIDNFPPELKREVMTLKVELAKIEKEHAQMQLDADTARHAESQATIRAELQHGTDYAKNTRPYIARLCIKAAIVYVVLVETLSRLAAFNGIELAGADAALVGVVCSPAWAYIGARSVDGFTKFGRTGVTQ